MVCINEFDYDDTKKYIEFLIKKKRMKTILKMDNYTTEFILTVVDVKSQQIEKRNNYKLIQFFQNRK